MGKIRLGLKLWSINEAYYNEAVRVVVEGHCQFIELFSIPDSFIETSPVWKRLRQETGIEFVIHAPHSMVGLNLSDPLAWRRNKDLADEAFRFADALDCSMVVFHPGIGGILNETIRQVTMLDNSRLLIENKPRFGLNGESCVGYTPEDISRILSETQCRFCFDFGHAIYAANALHAEALKFVDGFINLRPDLYHLTDGEFTGIYDAHVRYGYGNFPLAELMKKIPEGAMVTNEAKRDSDSRLNDFVEDALWLEKRVNRTGGSMI